MNGKIVLTERDVMELLAFFVTSSRGVVDEGKMYGSFRLMDAASRLLGLVLDDGETPEEHFFRGLREQIDIDGLLTLLMTDEDEYVRSVEGLVLSVTRKLKEQAVTDTC